MKSKKILNLIVLTLVLVFIFRIYIFSIANITKETALKKRLSHNSINTTQVIDDNYEENDEYYEAYDLSLYMGTFLYSIDGYGIQADDDWYEIFINRGNEHLIVDLTFSHSFGNIDLAVHDDTGSLIISSTSSTDNEKIDYVLPSNGTYYIRVYGNNSGTTYDLK